MDELYLEKVNLIVDSLTKDEKLSLKQVKELSKTYYNSYYEHNIQIIQNTYNNLCNLKGPLENLLNFMNETYEIRTLKYSSCPYKIDFIFNIDPRPLLTLQEESKSILIKNIQDFMKNKNIDLKEKEIVRFGFIILERWFENV